MFFQAAALGAFFINAILGVLAAPEVLHVGQAALVMTVHAVEIRIDHLHTRGAAMVGDNVTDVESLCAIHVGDQTAEPRHRRLIRISRFDGLVDAAQIVHVAVFPEDFEFRVQRGDGFASFGQRVWRLHGGIEVGKVCSQGCIDSADVLVASAQVFLESNRCVLAITDAPGAGIGFEIHQSLGREFIEQDAWLLGAEGGVFAQVVIDVLLDRRVEEIQAVASSAAAVFGDMPVPGDAGEIRVVLVFFIEPDWGVHLVVGAEIEVREGAGKAISRVPVAGGRNIGKIAFSLGMDGWLARASRMEFKAERLFRFNELARAPDADQQPVHAAVAFERFQVAGGRAEMRRQAGVGRCIPK